MSIYKAALGVVDVFYVRRARGRHARRGLSVVNQIPAAVVAVGVPREAVVIPPGQRRRRPTQKTTYRGNDKYHSIHNGDTWQYNGSTFWKSILDILIVIKNGSNLYPHHLY